MHAQSLPLLESPSFFTTLRRYRFDVKYEKGATLVVSDALSRLKFIETTPLDQVIPMSFLTHTFFMFDSHQHYHYLHLARDADYHVVNRLEQTTSSTCAMGNKTPDTHLHTHATPSERAQRTRKGS